MVKVGKNNTSFSYQVYEGNFLIGNQYFTVADRNITTAFSLRTATTYNFKGLFGNHAKWIFGAEYTRGINEFNEFGNGFESAIVSARTATDRSVLGFSQLEFELPKDITLTLGASFNNFRLDFQERLLPMENPYFSKEVNDFSPRIALTKKISEGLFLYTNVSKGFASSTKRCYR